MNAKDFIHRLKQIKAEILAFKQYKKIGVGRADFPRAILTKSVPTEGNYNFRLTIEFENASTLPYMQFFARYGYETLPGGNYTFQNNIYINNFQSYAFDDLDYEVVVVATAPIKSAVLEVV